jgi:hypothetical protein
LSGERERERERERECCVVWCGVVWCGVCDMHDVSGVSFSPSSGYCFNYTEIFSFILVAEVKLELGIPVDVELYPSYLMQRVFGHQTTLQ